MRVKEQDLVEGSTIISRLPSCSIRLHILEMILLGRRWNALDMGISPKTRLGSLREAKACDRIAAMRATGMVALFF